MAEAAGAPREGAAAVLLRPRAAAGKQQVVDAAGALLRLGPDDGGAQAPELLRAGQAALADAAALRSEYLQALRAVLTANRDMEAKLRGTDARIAAVRLQNDELEADLARAAGRQPPPAPATIDDRTVRECQRVARGWLGRRRALAVAVAVASGDPALL